MSVEHDILLDNCIEGLLNSDLTAVDCCVQQLPSHYATFLFLRLNKMSDENLQKSLVNLRANPLNITTLANRTPVPGLCFDDFKCQNFIRCRIWVDSGLVNLEHLYGAWDSMLETASPTTIEQSVVFFSQLPYYSAYANAVWSKAFELWLRQITDKSFSVPSSPNFTSYNIDVSETFVGVIVPAQEPVKSELFWRAVATLHTLETTDAVVHFLRSLVEHGCDFNLPSYPLGGENNDANSFIHEVEHTLFQLKGERLKRLAGIEGSGSESESERRKI